MFFAAHYSSPSREIGQVAQLVERSPEKAGVGGSIPSLATIIAKDLNDSTFLLSVYLRQTRKKA